MILECDPSGYFFFFTYFFKWENNSHFVVLSILKCLKYIFGSAQFLLLCMGFLWLWQAVATLVAVSRLFIAAASLFYGTLVLGVRVFRVAARQL